MQAPKEEVGKENKRQYRENVLTDYKPDKFEDDWDDDTPEPRPK